MSGGTVSRGSKAARGGGGGGGWEEEARRVYRLRMAQPGVKGSAVITCICLLYPEQQLAKRL